MEIFEKRSDFSVLHETADFRTAFMPDSENIEHAEPKGSNARLFERGGNPRQILRRTPCEQREPSPK